MSTDLHSVLFDLDGTLVDTAPDFIVAVNALRHSHQLPPLPDASIAEQVSNGSIALTRHAFDIDESSREFDSLRAQLLANYLDCIGQHARLYHGLDMLLQALENSGRQWGVVTNKPLTYAQPLMDKLSLSDRCGTLICPDHVSEPKPHPEALFMAADALGSAVEKTVYIGDHHRDISAGQAAGMKTVAAAYGYIEASDNVEHWRADRIVQQPGDLHSTLEQLYACKI